jgi:hypothetical protein
MRKVHDCPTNRLQKVQGMITKVWESVLFLKLNANALPKVTAYVSKILLGLMMFSGSKTFFISRMI